jgi:uncharacterized RDD family membrane protein YckC
MQEQKELPTAQKSQRVFNFLIDQFAIMAIIGIVQPTFGVENIEIKTLQDIALMPKAVILINLSVSIMYYFGLEYASGTTLGKLLSGTYVQFNPEKNKAWLCFVRTITRLIPLYALICLFTRGKLWHDRTSNTQVLSSRPPIQIR